MELYPPFVRKLWNEWDLRIMVLCSLILQILLIFLGNRRNYINKLWIRIVVWSAYVAADSVAIFALGVLSNNFIELYDEHVAGLTLDAHTQLSAFWAPFLVLHLGGPDTITAYALEDNELWRRHLLGVVVQTGMALSIFLMSWTGSTLSILSLVMFLPGIVKYGERTWALRSATFQKRQKFTVPFDKGTLDMFFERFRVEQFEENKLVIAVALQYLNGPFVFDSTAHPSLLNQKRNVDLFKDMLPEEAFKEIEIELGFAYDLLYTKAPLLYTRWGLILRVITFFLTCSVTVLFPVLVDEQKYSKVDVLITYLLIMVAVIHDIYTSLLIVWSDGFAGWLKLHNKDTILKALNGFKLFESPRWSNKVSQYTLLSFTSSKAKPHMFSKLLHTRRDMGANHWYSEISEDLRKLIFNHVKTRDAEMTLPPRENPFTKLPFTPAVDVYRANDQSLEGTIVVWHIATEICYYLDREHLEQDFLLKCKSIKRISRYMLHLLVEHPSLLSVQNSTELRDSIRETADGIEKVVRRAREAKSDHILSKAEACKSLYESEVQFSDIFVTNPSFAMTTIKQMKVGEASLESRWKRIAGTWMDLLGFAARRCKGNEHSQQLRRGGEFLTHVWLLLFHFGCTEHFDVYFGRRNNVDFDEEEKAHLNDYSDLQF